MAQPPGDAMLERFIRMFCDFWASNRPLIRRIHGIAAVDPEFGAVIEARNRRRFLGASRIARTIALGREAEQRATVLAALTSFEFFDALAENSENGKKVAATILALARYTLSVK